MIIWSRFFVNLKCFQTRIHTGLHLFTKIGQILHNFFITKNTFQIEIWPISCLNDSEIQERGLQGVKIHKIAGFQCHHIQNISK